jgi:hypothetical protein
VGGIPHPGSTALEAQVTPGHVVGGKATVRDARRVGTRGGGTLSQPLLTSWPPVRRPSSGLAPTTAGGLWMAGSRPAMTFGVGRFYHNVMAAREAAIQRACSNDGGWALDGRVTPGHDVWGDHSGVYSHRSCGGWIRAHFSSPPPCGEGKRWGLYVGRCARLAHFVSDPTASPTPPLTPPRRGEGDQSGGLRLRLTGPIRALSGRPHNVMAAREAAIQ